MSTKMFKMVGVGVAAVLATVATPTLAAEIPSIELTFPNLQPDVFTRVTTPTHAVWDADAIDSDTGILYVVSRSSAAGAGALMLMNATLINAVNANTHTNVPGQVGLNDLSETISINGKGPFEITAARDSQGSPFLTGVQTSLVMRVALDHTADAVTLNTSYTGNFIEVRAQLGGFTTETEDNGAANTHTILRSAEFLAFGASEGASLEFAWVLEDHPTTNLDPTALGLIDLFEGALGGTLLDYNILYTGTGGAHSKSVGTVDFDTSHFASDFRTWSSSSSPTNGKNARSFVPEPGSLAGLLAMVVMLATRRIAR